ncbi:MAG TPA: hypothetical protein DIT13_02880 [Verrucomicrobiales bacterium]|nr:hypothetical protein [Verrucomicrobiales bacterium]HRJ08056.1 FecR family protein [Prosthecobacter sp.]HRK14514.1 FecR family protein [Prosthecobacter sp.]
MSTDWNDLIQRHIAGLTTEAEAAQLQQALKADDSLADLYIRHIELDVALEAKAASAEATRELLTAPVADEARRSTRWLAWRPLAAAAAVALLGMAGTLWLRTIPWPRGASATLVSADNARIVGVDGELIAGRELRLKELRLETGRLEIALASGARLEMSAPVEGEFFDDMRLRLDSGGVNADVGEHGKGFTIETAAGEIVDLGTRFGVQADRSGESRVAVFSGKVEVHSRQPRMGGVPVTLTEGMAARFSAQAGLRGWRQVAVAAQEAGLAAAHYTGIVERVHDNLGDEELEPFYGVVQRGMAPGVLAFADKPNPRWAPRPGDEVPASLLGADLIRTYHQFRRRGSYELTVTLREPAVVYVLIKAQDQLPEWLAEKFSPTGETVIAGPLQVGIASWPDAILDEEGRPYFKFAVWKANAPAGEFTLGTARSAERQLMYGLAIQPQKMSPP